MLLAFLLTLAACRTPDPAAADSGAGSGDGGAQDGGASGALQPHLLPGPDEEGHDADLAALADLYDRQNLAINSSPFGLSLDAYFSEHAAVDAWLADGSGYSRDEFEAHSGADLYDQVYFFGEIVDLGMFGGVGSVAEATRYALLRDGQAVGTDTVDAARQRVERAMLALHMMATMPGEPGVLVRGLGPKELPGVAGQEPIPLFDDQGNPQPEDKGATWREDFSGQYPDFLWLDDTSKDQWIGYVFALGMMWEVVADDPDIDADLKTALQDDARTMGLALQRVNPDTGLDLTLFDADGRPTNHHDLSAREVEGVVSDELINPFNATMALAGLTVFADISGDPDVAAFKDEVAFDRGYAEIVPNVGGVLYLYYLTNYSNVNMAFTALHTLLHFETDPDLVALYRDAAVAAWADGTDRAPWHFQAAYFDLLLAAYVPDADTDGLLTRVRADLSSFHTPPYWDDPVENCDEEELTTGHCVGIDGVTEIDLYGSWEGDVFVPGEARNAYPVATSYVPQSIRPASNFEWRSDPYRLNWTGTDGLYPGGDFRAAYWLGRYLRRPSQ